MKKFSWALIIAIFLGGSAGQIGCSPKTALQKKTLAYKKKVRKGKAIPCPCNDK